MREVRDRFCGNDIFVDRVIVLEEDVEVGVIVVWGKVFSRYGVFKMLLLV